MDPAREECYGSWKKKRVEVRGGGARRKEIKRGKDRIFNRNMLHFCHGQCQLALLVIDKINYLASSNFKPQNFMVSSY